MKRESLGYWIGLATGLALSWIALSFYKIIHHLFLKWPK